VFFELGFHLENLGNTCFIFLVLNKKKSGQDFCHSFERKKHNKPSKFLSFVGIM